MNPCLQIGRFLLQFALAAVPMVGPSYAIPLQPLVDAAPPGSTLVLAPGAYEGPVLIAKPLTLDGSERRAIVGGGGTGTIFTVRAPGVTLRNLTIENSGSSHDTVDAGILLESSGNRITGNLIRDTLFGIDLKESHGNRIEGNEIISKRDELGLRGDSIRLWASHRNTILDNRIHDSRDLVVWYSNRNKIERNRSWNNRYSVHFMYGEDNEVRDNDFRHNSVGVYLMYSKRTRLVGNRIFNSLGAGGVGLGLKDSDGITIEDNTVVYCAVGIHIDQSPIDDEAVNRFGNNEVAYNVVGILFHSDLVGNEFRGNRMSNNLHAVEVDGNGAARGNLWEGNYWSEYEGFDRNRDNRGDSPFEYRTYMDQLWTTEPAVRFFYGSPVLSFLDYLARLAPFSEPRLILIDKAPLYGPPPPLASAFSRDSVVPAH